jgi:hypothetical protein
VSQEKDRRQVQYRVTAVSAERVLEFVPSEGAGYPVTVRLGVARRDRVHPNGAWVCPYEIRGFRKVRRRWAFGIDGIQALTLAFHILPVELGRLAKQAGGGTFHFLGEPGVGFADGCKLLLDDLLDASVSRRAQGRSKGQNV